MNETAYIVLRIAGACYLLYLGIGMIFSQKTSEFEETKTDRDTLSVIRHGIMINLLNPKLTLFFFSFLPQYVRAGGGSQMIIQSALLGVAFMALTFVVFVGYGILAGTAKNFLLHSPKSILLQDNLMQLLHSVKSMTALQILFLLECCMDRIDCCYQDGYFTVFLCVS